FTKIFRQASNSSIIKLSHAIKNGNPIDILGNFQDREFHISNKVNLVETTLNIYKNLLSITNADKIQILIPMYKSIFGIDKFNTLIQQTFNHNTEQIEYGNCIYKIDDRVMQLENRAEDNIFNGDVGNIDSIFTEDGKQKV
ncbi:ATP-dependent RecD-like DNA helicase, partial [Streptococcus danieliae]|nr:ATP-dependent RecD-like DNA helicase [Streptococcus danieliae]